MCTLAQAIGADLTLADREFGGAVARISLPLVPAGGAAESGDPMYVQAPDWRPQNG